MMTQVNSGSSTALVSVIIPCYNAEAFIGRALGSLRAQSCPHWEGLIINDGSRDSTEDQAKAFLEDSRFRYHSLPQNRGLGAALNYGLEWARGELIAYLPADDLYYPGHLESLRLIMQTNSAAAAVFSGLRHHQHSFSAGQIEGLPLQLVQVMHRKTGARWVERKELVTDDLERMFWHKLRPLGDFKASGEVSAEWVAHPLQRHKLICEPLGGLYRYKSHYGVREPLHFHSTAGCEISENEQYHRFSGRAPSADAGGLKILLVGELSINPERILALEEAGHTLYGLWVKDPHWYNATGPLAFGHIQDLPRDNWLPALKAVKPDIIYALLNWQAVPLAHQVLRSNSGIPFVWHFKGSPFACLEKGLWPELVALYSASDGQIYSSPEMRDWFESAMPQRFNAETQLVLDGDLPKADWFFAHRAGKISALDGEVHTVVAGGPLGLRARDAAELGARGVHLHFYLDFNHVEWRHWLREAGPAGERCLHLHFPLQRDRWVAEFSKYDAGWLSAAESLNQGEIARADCHDLEYPAWLPALAAAGLPVILRDNSGKTAAVQSLARKLGAGVFFSDPADLALKLKDQKTLTGLQENMWRERLLFSFDYHAGRLAAFFEGIIRHKDMRAPAAPLKLSDPPYAWWRTSRNQPQL